MICKCCNLNKEKTLFSNSQLKRKQDDRKCKDCSQEPAGDNFETFTLEHQKVLFSNLISWLRKNGAEFPHLEIKHYNERFRGIVATKNIYKCKQILKVPHKCIMTTLKAYETEVGLELKSSGWEPHSSHTWLAVMLLQEKLNPNSFWKPFIDILPPNYNDFPQFYNNEELKQLSGSFILDMIKSRNLNLEQEFNELLLAIPIFGKKITLKDYVWARIAIVSRVFHIAYDDNKTTQGIVPMADMLNHSKEPGTKWSFVPNEDAFIISSDKFLIKDKEVFDTYGAKCNSRYLVNYGFTLSDNQENNQAAIFIDPVKILSNKNSVLNESKLKILGNNSTTIDDSYCEYRYLINAKKETLISQDQQYRFQFITLLDKKVDSRPKSITGLHSIWCLFGMLRLLFSSEIEFLQFTIKINNKIKELKDENVKLDLVNILLSIPPFSVETELLVLKELSTICEKVLDGFPTTVEMDQKELESTLPYSNRWNILNLLIGEKKVLLYYRELGVYINNLWNESKDVRKVGKILRKNTEYAPYHKVYWEQLII
jgi:histone-lysine N-methyltransferase SETD3